MQYNSFEEKYLTVVATIQETAERTIEKMLDEQLPIDENYKTYTFSYTYLFIIMRMSAIILKKISKNDEELAKNIEEFYKQVKLLIKSVRIVPAADAQQ